MKDIVIIGAGTAGLTAAIYSLRAGKSVLLIESQMYGGQIVNTPDIENYPGISHVSGFDFAQGLYDQAVSFGAELVYETATAIDNDGDRKVVRTASGNSYECRAVILATGAKNRKLGIAREEELTGHGISYCATCDGMFFKGKDVAVAGGGSTALGDAAYLADLCSKVYLIHRRDAFRGVAADVEKLKEKKNVEFVLNANVTAVLGDKTVEGVEVTDKLTGEKRVLPVSALFVGQTISRLPMWLISTRKAISVPARPARRSSRASSQPATAGPRRFASSRQLLRTEPSPRQPPARISIRSEEM